MLCTKFQPQTEEDFSVFLPYTCMGMASILFNDAEPFEQRVNMFNRRPHVKSGENWSSGFREDV